MKTPHMKGIALQQLADGAMWDYELAAKVMSALQVSGRYWYGTVRLMLTDLAAGGLIAEVGTAVDPDRSYGEETILFRFALTDFGRERMAQAGLAGGRKA